MIFTYEKGPKQFFTRKQYRRHNALRANYFAQHKRLLAVSNRETLATLPQEKFWKPVRSEQRAYDAWIQAREAAFTRGERFMRRKLRTA